MRARIAPTASNHQPFGRIDNNAKNNNNNNIKFPSPELSNIHSIYNAAPVAVVPRSKILPQQHIPVTNKNYPSISVPTQPELISVRSRINVPLARESVINNNNNNNNNIITVQRARIDIVQDLNIEEEDDNDPAFDKSLRGITSYARGYYWIRESLFTQTHENELVLYPQYPKKYKKYQKNDVRPTCCWKTSEDNRWVGLPCVYGFTRLGEPHKPYNNLWKNISPDLIKQVAIDIHKNDGVSPYYFSSSLWSDEQRGAFKSVFDAITNAKRLGIIVLPCGYGKTVVSIKVLSFILEMNKKLRLVKNGKVLVITPWCDISEQWEEEIEEFMPNAKVYICSGEKEYNKKSFTSADIVITNIQFLVSKIKKWEKSDLYEWFESFLTVVIDECHHMGADEFRRVFEFIPWERIIGLSATPERKDGRTKLNEIFIGPVLYKAVRPPMPWFHIIFQMYHHGKRKIYFRKSGIYKNSRDTGKMEEDISADPLRNAMIVSSIINTVNIRMIQKRDIKTNKNPFNRLSDKTIDIIASFLSLPEIREYVVFTDRCMRERFNRPHCLVTCRLRDHVMVLKKMFMQQCARLNMSVSCSTYMGAQGKKISRAQRNYDKSAQVIFATLQSTSEAFNLPSLDKGWTTHPVTENTQCAGRFLRKDKLKFRPTLIHVIDSFANFEERGEMCHDQYSLEWGCSVFYQHFQPPSTRACINIDNSQDRDEQGGKNTRKTSNKRKFNND